MDEVGESAGGASGSFPARRIPPPPPPPPPGLIWPGGPPPFPHHLPAAFYGLPAPVPRPLDLKKDLWLSTADDRYNSPPIPVRVGHFPGIETFYVHRSILVKFKWFEKALCSGFKEAEDQAVDLPEEDPAVFHFVVAFMYEGRYEPIQPAASVLKEVPDKGKGKKNGPPPVAYGSDSSSTSDTYSTSSRIIDAPSVPGPGYPHVIYATSPVRSVATSRRERRRRARNHHVHLPEKERNVHRADCRCRRCATTGTGRCGRCGTLPEHPPVGISMMGRARQIQNGGPMNPSAERVDQPSQRIPPEEMPSWLMAYELNLDVYICAVRLLMDDLQAAVSRSTIDMLETAGSEAAQIEVLRLCAKLCDSVPETDPLLTMILARVGFLQALLWSREPAETGEFLVANPELAAMMLRETSRRHDSDASLRNLPAMDMSLPAAKPPWRS